MRKISITNIYFIYEILDVWRERIVITRYNPRGGGLRENLKWDVHGIYAGSNAGCAWDVAWDVRGMYAGYNAGAGIS